MRRFVVSLLILCISGLLVRDCVCEDGGVSVLKVIQSHNILNLTLFHSNVSDYKVGHNFDTFETSHDIITKYGYPAETHTIITEDGYLLTVHRIPGSPRATSSGCKAPVVLMHGLGSSSDSFVLLGPEKSLGFLLADQGYDVWMGNLRGNIYARKHLTLSPKDPQFWKFTWHEMGLYDLRGTIDHVLNTTNHQQVFSIGHSMGGTAFFVLTSIMPEYNQKIRLFVGMNPAVYFRPMRSSLAIVLAPLTRLISRLFKGIGLYEFPRVKIIHIILSKVCREGNPLLEVCLFAYATALGENRAAFDTKLAPVLIPQGWSGFALESLVHYGENYVADRFQVYDPKVRLGRATTKYNLSQVTTPVYLLYSDNDQYIHSDAVMRLGNELPNVVGYYRVPDKLTTHSDFVFSKYVKQNVNEPIIAELEKYK